MGQILNKGFVYWDGLKYVLDPLSAVAGPQGPGGPEGPAGPPGSNSIGLGNILYVGKAGNDTTGNGTFDNPYLTINQANTVLKNKTLGPGGQLWTILIGAGTYTENLAVLPNASYLGFDTSAENAVLNGNITLDSSWTGFGLSIAFVGAITLIGTITANFASFSNDSLLSLFACNVNGTISATGLGGNHPNLGLELCKLTQSATITNGRVVSNQTQFLSGLTVSASASPASWISHGSDTVAGGVILNGLSFVVPATIFGGSSLDSLTLNGTHATYLSPIGSIPSTITLTGGALSSQITTLGRLPINNLAPSTTDGYVATTIGGVSVWAPSSGSSGGIGINAVYVSPNGSDITGTGTLAFPFATYSHSTTIIGGKATSSNFWSVILGPGSYSENINLVPWITAVGIDIYGSSVLNGNIGLASSFSGSSAFVSGISSASINGNVNLNFLGVGSLNGSAEMSDVIFEGTFSAEGNGTSVNKVGLINCNLNLGTSVNDIQINSQFTLFSNITINAPSFGSTLNLFGSSINGNLTVNGASGHTSVITAIGSGLTGNLTLNGTQATYSASIGGIPTGTISFTNGALSSQYDIFGELPVANITPANTDGYVITTRSGIAQWLPPSSLTAGLGKTIFIDNAGSDTLGTGSILNPFATIAKANTVMAGLSIVGQFNGSIYFGNGTWSENWKVLPGVSYIGFDDGRRNILTGNATLDSSWSIGGNSSSISYLTNLFSTGGFSFTFVSASALINQLNCQWNTTNCTMTGVGDSGLNFNLISCQFGINLTITTAAGGGSSNTFTNLILQDSSSLGCSWLAGGGDSIRIATCNGINHEAILAGNSSSFSIGTLNLNGTHAQYNNAGIADIPATINLTNGASSPTYLGELPPINVMPSVTDGYVLTTSAGVAKWLALSKVGSGGLGGITYVGKLGNDTTGDGSFENPFLTITKATAVVKTFGLTNDSSIWTIQIGPGIYNENVAIIPSVSYLGFDLPAVSVQITGNITLDSSWTGFGDTATAFGGIGFQGGSINANFLATGNDALLLFSFCSINVPVTIDGFGSGFPNISSETCGFLPDASPLTINNSLLSTSATSFDGVNLIINATTGPASWESEGADLIVGGLTLNGTVFSASANVSGGSSVDVLTLNGTQSTYTSPIGSIPDSITLTGGALSSQITITGHLPPANITPATTDGYVITTVSGLSVWAPSAGGGGGGGSITLLGDTVGTGTSTIITTTQLINHASVPLAGALTTGNVLRVSGASSLTYSALNLAGGSGWITGNLPTTNFAPGSNGQVLFTTGGVATWGNFTTTNFTPGTNGQVLITAGGITTWGSLPSSSLPTITLTGDTTGSGAAGTINTTTVKINGAAVSAAGGLTTGNGLHVSGPSTLTYGPLNLSGGANFVINTLPVNNIAPSITNGQVLTTVGGATAWATAASGGITQLTQDVLAGPGSGSVAATVVQAQAGVFAFGAGGTMTWSATSAWLMMQASTSASPANNAIWKPQQSTTGTGGNAVISLQVPAGGGTEALFQIQRGTSNRIQFGPIPGASTYGGIYLGNITPSGTTNFSIASDGITQLAFNSPANAPINLTAANAIIGSFSLLSSAGTLWLTQGSPSNSNYAISNDGTATSINASTGGSLYLRIGGVFQSIQQSNALFVGPNLSVSATGTISLGSGGGNIFYIAPATTLPSTALSSGIAMGVDSTGLRFYNSIFTNSFITLGGYIGGSGPVGVIGGLWLSAGSNPTQNNFTLGSDGSNVVLNTQANMYFASGNTAYAFFVPNSFMALKGALQLGSTSVDFGGGVGGILSLQDASGSLPTTHPTTSCVLAYNAASGNPAAGLHAYTNGIFSDYVLAPRWTGSAGSQAASIYKFAGIQRSTTSTPVIICTINLSQIGSTGFNGTSMLVCIKTIGRALTAAPPTSRFTDVEMAFQLDSTFSVLTQIGATTTISDISSLGVAAITYVISGTNLQVKGVCTDGRTADWTVYAEVIYS